MPTEIKGNVPDARFWMSRKFWFTVLGAGIFLVLALTGTMAFTNVEAITVILGLIGLNVGAHTATDITSILAGRQRGGESAEIRELCEAIALLTGAFERLRDDVLEIEEEDKDARITPHETPIPRNLKDAE